MEKNRQATLFGFFSSVNKRRRRGSEQDLQQQSETRQPNPCQHCQRTEPQPGTSSSIQNTQPNSSQSYNRYDIGTFSSQNCSDQEKYNYITKTWVPTANYKFPSGKRNLKFQHQWFTDFLWLAYSEARGAGAFCKFCAIFSAEFESGKGAHVQLGAFVKIPFTKWKNAKQEFRDHEKKGYHIRACTSSQNFISFFEKKTDDVHIQLNTQYKKTISENREKLAPIVNTVLFCGRHGLPLRGHRDYGPFQDDESVSGKDGKFRALLRFRIEAGDVALKTHLASAGANATYLSQDIQNEIIHVAGGLVCKKLVERIIKSHYFSVLADETADVSGTEQFALCARYVDKDKDDFIIREDFLKFVPVYDLRGFALADVLKENVHDLGLNLNNIRGLGFDGAANMSGAFNGCAAKFQESYPQAIYVHCANHSLNLALSHSCTVSAIKNCLGNINKIITFFRASPKRENVLKDRVLQVDSKARRTRLLKFCETRWVERLDAVSLFVELFPLIIESLIDIQEFTDSEASSQAFSYLAAIQKPTFVVSMVVASHVFSLSHGLASLLQSKQMDISRCVELCENLEKELDCFRLNFRPLYKEAENVAERIGIALQIPRIVRRQTGRSNFETDNPEEYFRLSVFLPFIDFFISQLKDRFLNHKGILKNIQTLVPRNIVRASDADLHAAVDAVVNQWPHDVDASPESFFNELKMWRRHFLEQKDLHHHLVPGDFISSLNMCSDIIFPCTHKVLKLFCTIPVTTATSERSFSTLRYLKTYLRSTMGADRLNGLALLFIHHREVEIETNEILDEMSKKPRRLLL